MTDAADQDLRIEYVRLDVLKAAPRNPTGHDIPEIEGAIRRFGYIDPIVVDESSGSIVAGHGRVETLEGMRDHGEDPPSRIKVDDDGQWLAPVLRGVDFADEDEAEAYLLAANRVGALGIDNEETLAAMLSDLARFEGPGLAGTGFDDEDLADLLRRTAAPAPPKDDTADPAPAPEPDITLRQIVIPLGDEEYDETMAALRSLREEFDAESNTEVILRLIHEAREEIDSVPVVAVGATVFADLAEFARIEVEAHDLEPWAEMIQAMCLAGDVDEEGAHWLVKAYNAYDDLGSAMAVTARWPSPAAWAEAPDRHEAADYPCTQERRNLRGGRVLKHLDSYIEHLNGATQAAWLSSVLAADSSPEENYVALLAHMRGVWGTGRQSAFEWAEFVMKVLDFPIAAPDAQLWESEGPRRSLQRLYGNPEPDLAWLNEKATVCREMIAEAGTPLSWEDFETVICDFNVMRDGRYYPGRHLAALREEIDSIPEEQREALDRAWDAFVPSPWNGIAPGIDKTQMPIYRDTGSLAPAFR